MLEIFGKKALRGRLTLKAKKKADILLSTNQHFEIP